jgi:hypothetical protein
MAERHSSGITVCGTVLLAGWVGLVCAQGGPEFLTMTKEQATSVGATMRRTDSVGNRMTIRGLKTDRAISYKMRATWLTPDVIRATARLAQLAERLSPEKAQGLVAEAEAAGDTVFLIELDPNEGSGVIPLDWTAILQPKGLAPGDAGAMPGKITEKLRDVRALSGVFRRDYAYDVFWAVFSLKTAAGAPVLPESTADAELIVNIRGSEGAVSWPVPDSIRKRVGIAK